MEVKKASNFIYYSANIPYTLQNNIAIDAIGNILFTRYLESVREKEGGSYGVGVRGVLNNTPANKAILLMQFDT
ncbi:MAG: peptidase domain protein, partial [Bacteroidetes bacterium]|nr:peptidase domain protein [Bacteroidota bacterium]